MLAHLAAGIVAFRRGHMELARHELREVPREVWARMAPGEYVRSGLAVAPDETLREIRALVADDPPAVTARSWFDVLTPVFGAGEQDLARELFAIFDRRTREDTPPWPKGEMHREWMRPWLAADPGSPSAPAPEAGRRTIAILDYGHPSATKASANIGDHLQSLAALGHFVRHTGVRFHGRPELVGLLERLQARTLPERRRPDVQAEVDVVTVHRDASTYQPLPEDAWVLCFGWFMHPLFRMRHDFPLHRNLRPIFVSFHCNKRSLLTSEAVAYLKRYGPVGCRDWTTVYLLLSLGVPAFFSGCLTTTIGALFPQPSERPGPDAPMAYVDVDDAPPGAITYRHSQEAVRQRPFVENVDAAVELLETYRRRHRKVVTRRLHCCLPARSVGLDVEFRPRNRSDVRFDGLLDLSDAGFAAMRDGIDAKLEPVLAATLAGRSEEEVYALWRDVTAADVAAAKERRDRDRELEPEPAEIEARLRPVASRTSRRDGAAADPVHCAVVLPAKHGVRGLAVLVASLLEHASRPLHVWVLALPGADGEDRLRARFPQIGLSWIPLRGIGRGVRLPTGERAGPERVARLLIADLLAGVDRLVVLPLPSVATADVADLAELDLGEHALAAPTTRSSTDLSGFGVIDAAANRLGELGDVAAELRRLAHARHAFDFDAFGADVLVLDLARLRADRFGARALALVQRFGLDHREAMHVLVGPGRAVIPDRWAVVPTRTPIREPGLVHWADAVKPWQPELAPERDLWRDCADALSRQPAGAPALRAG